MGDDILDELRRSLGASTTVDAAPIENTQVEAEEHSGKADPVVGAAAIGIAEDLLALSPYASDQQQERNSSELSASVSQSRASSGQSSMGGPIGGEQVALALSVRGERAPLADGPVMIGRGRESFNPTDDGRVSRRHCAVQLGADGFAYVIDLGSANGTQIERAGTRLVVSDQWVQLNSGDVLVTTEGVVLGEIVGEAGVGR